LQSSLEGTGNNQIGVNIERGQKTTDVSALLDAFLVERSLLIVLELLLSCVGVSKKIYEH
jgi:hypothetical protein